MIESLIISLTLTLLIEVSIAFALGIRNKKEILVVVLANICTNPVVVFLTNLVMILKNKILFISILLFLEICAWIFEFLIYKNFLKEQKISPLKLSLTCNLISFGLGIIINIL